MPVHAFVGSLTRAMPQYGAANGAGISRLSFDETTGKLVALGVTGGIDDSGWLVTNRAGDRLYATCEVAGTRESAVTAYRVDPSNGDLTLINQVPTGGNEACHASLTPNGRFLAVANYNGATPAGWPDQSIAIFPLAADGALLRAAVHIRHTGSGPNADRQTTAHAHCVIATPDGQLLYVADLGIDRLVAYRLGSEGDLTAAPERDFVLPPGLGPRHIVFSQDGRHLFMVSELTPTVMSFALAADGALGVVSTIPVPPYSDTIVQPAGIVLSPDGRHLLVSLRVCDEIVGFAVDAKTGVLRQTGRWPCGGVTPRALEFVPSGRHVIVANQDADTLTVFAFDADRGLLGDIVQQHRVGTPISIAFAASHSPT
ncbi:6-phosphogluconolactonase [Devosia sp. UYZn731]|uniref:lactonase family protein n=1 Tax=Devosia sp. UYZn731 TaxID=3156345 RepID=UPI003392FA70